MDALKRINQSFWLALRDLRCYLMFTFKPEYVERQYASSRDASFVLPREIA
jgi:hypothetical protein